MTRSLKEKALINAISLTFALWIFALFVHSTFPIKSLSIIGLLLSSYFVGIIFLQNHESSFTASTWQWRNSLVITISLSLFASLVLSMLYRNSLDLPIIPLYVEIYAILFVIIGFAEEIVFRGIVQGASSQWNGVGSIIIGSGSHAGYKSLLFVLADQPIDSTIPTLFLVTFIAGLFLGFTRYKTNSLWPCLLAHGLFDLWVYAEQSTAPWWVW
jgi:membrane protease YdiL (CAAX protease family)